jgi:hypothetical protein
MLNNSERLKKVCSTKVGALNSMLNHRGRFKIVYSIIGVVFSHITVCRDKIKINVNSLMSHIIGGTIQEGHIWTRFGNVPLGILQNQDGHMRDSIE